MIKRQHFDDLERLTNLLGPAMVALIAGIHDMRTPRSWLKDLEATPTPEATFRIGVAIKVADYLVNEEGDYTTRAWFIGSGVPGYEDSEHCLNPALALRLLPADENLEIILMSAARSFVSSSFV
jgi:hypothetical protein